MAGGFRIDHDVERLEVEPDQLGCVYGLPGTLRDHERYGLAHETDMPGGERRPRENRRHDWKADASRKAKVGGGQHGDDAWRGSRRFNIDSPNRGVRKRRPHKGNVETALRLDVVDVAARAGDQAGRRTA